MLAPLEYGRDRRIALPAEAFRARVVGLPRNVAAIDAVATLKQALESPRDFPALALAIVPDDQIVLALGDDLPTPAALVAGVVEYLLEHGVAPAQIRVLRTKAEEARGIDPLAACPEAARAEIRVVTHHPEIRGDLAYLAADEAAEPIYFQRCLIEADLIIPILPAARSATRHSPTGLYPTYADDRAQERHRAAGKAHASKKGNARTFDAQGEEPHDALLGVLFAVRAVAIDEDRPLAIFAGACETVDREATALRERLCTARVGAPVRTLVAAVSGKTPLSWRRFADLVASLLPRVLADGKLALCVELESELPPALQSWAASSWLDEVLEELKAADVPGWQTALELSAAREHARIYLISNLAQSAVEDLGFAPIAEAAELARIIGDGDDALIVHHADRMTLVE